MSVQVATSTALGTGGLRQRSLTRAASRVVRPLAKFVNIPGIQDFAHTAQELAVTLKPWALQAPGVNDMAAKSIVLHIEEISAMIAQQMEKMDMGESAIVDTEAQLSRLGEFTRYLQDTKAELETYQQQSYSTKIAFQTEMATMLVERESELRHRVLVFCLENALHIGHRSVRTQGTAEHIQAQIAMLQVQVMVMVRSQREAATSMAEMKAQIAGVTKVIDRIGYPESQILLFITTIHRSNFFLIFDFSA